MNDLICECWDGRSWGRSRPPPWQNLLLQPSPFLNLQPLIKYPQADLLTSSLAEGKFHKVSAAGKMVSKCMILNVGKTTAAVAFSGRTGAILRGCLDPRCVGKYFNKPSIGQTKLYKTKPISTQQCLTFKTVYGIPDHKSYGDKVV